MQLCNVYSKTGAGTGRFKMMKTRKDEKTSNCRIRYFMTYVLAESKNKNVYPTVFKCAKMKLILKAVPKTFRALLKDETRTHK